MKNKVRREEEVEFDIEAEQFIASYDSSLDTVEVFVKEEDELIELVV